MEALRTCARAQSSLLIINSSLLQNEVIRNLREDIGILPPENWESSLAPGYWIGGSDLEEEGKWRWRDGSSVPSRSDLDGYQNWYAFGEYDEPGATTPETDCLYISGLVNVVDLPRTLGSWFDSDCSAQKYFICQRSTSSPGEFAY